MATETEQATEEEALAALNESAVKLAYVGGHWYSGNATLDQLTISLVKSAQANIDALREVVRMKGH